MTTQIGTRSPHWLERASALLYMVFCFEVGVFLLVFPWLDFWERSFFSNLAMNLLGRDWEQVWDSAWFRGAVSGVGLVNIWISFAEAFRLRRPSAPPDLADADGSEG